MRTIVVMLVWMALGQPCAGDEWFKTWTAAGDSWEERWENTLAGVNDLPREQKLEVLGRAVKLGLRTDTEFPNERKVKFSKEGVAKITVIPGHAEHFGDKITPHYESIKSRYALGQHNIPWWHFQRESMYAFQALSLLPSNETVRVLGEMLSDDWRPPYWHEEFNFVPLKERAVSALSKLPIAKPPTRQLHHAGDMRDYADDWGEWYAEIKAGHRTFRFIGDDTEYDLRGPVKRGGFGRTDRSGKRSIPDVETGKSPKAAEAEPRNLVPYLIASLFLAGGAWYLLRKKSS